MLCFLISVVLLQFNYELLAPQQVRKHNISLVFFLRSPECGHSGDWEFPGIFQDPWSVFWSHWTSLLLSLSCSANVWNYSTSVFWQKWCLSNDSVRNFLGWFSYFKEQKGYSKYLWLAKKNFKAFSMEAYIKQAGTMTINNQSMWVHFHFYENDTYGYMQ